MCLKRQYASLFYNIIKKKKENIENNKNIAKTHFQPFFIFAQL